MPGLVQRLTIFLIATAILGAGALVYLLLDGGQPDSLTSDLAGVGAALTLPGALPLHVIAPGGVLSEGVYAAGDDRLRVRVSANLDPGEGEQLAREERTLIFGLFEDHQAPYPGALSNTLRCPEELRPADIEPPGPALFLVSLYANDRYAFGGCADDLLRFRATVGAFYHPLLRQLMRVEYFEPKQSTGPLAGPDVLRSFRWAAR